MKCHEAFFAKAHCRIDLRHRRRLVGNAEYVATVSVVDPDSNELHPLVSHDGAPIIIAGATDALALSSTLTFLESRLGAFSEISRGCVEPALTATEGEPVMIEEL